MIKPLVKIMILCSISVLGCNAASGTQSSANAENSHTENSNTDNFDIHARSKNIENIYGVIVSAKNLKVQIVSNGCTNKDSFELIWQGNNLTVMRKKTDNCRRMPYKKWLTFHIPREKKTFVLLNLLSATALKNTFTKTINVNKKENK